MEQQSDIKYLDEKFKTLFESVNAAAFLTEIDGKILEANQKSCELYSHDWDSLINNNISKIFPESERWFDLREEIISKGGMNFESINIQKDGTQFPVSISTSLFKMEGKPVILALIWDITERKEAEEKIRSSEERYRCIFDNSAVAIMLTDEKECIVSWNKFTETLLGMSEEDLKNKSVSMLYPPNEWARIRLENIREKGGQNHLETKIFKKNGELIDIDISLSVFKNNSGEITGSIGVIKDITERKKAEKKLRESEEKYEGLFEYTTDGMIVLDARGEIQDVNNRALELLGLSQDQMIGNNFLSMGFLTPKSLSIFVNQFQELLSKRIATSNETEIKNSNGTIVDVELSSFFLVKKENEIDNFVLVIRDISERKHTEIKLAREHELLQTLMDSIPDSIYFKDDENKFVMVNKAKAARSNVNPEDMIGKTDFDFLPEEEARKVFEDDAEVMKTGKFIINKVERLTSIDGSEKWVSVTKFPRFDNEGNIIGSMGISRDITELKKLEAMHQHNVE
ncbi:MAG: PAS domain-containing protein [Thermoplasmatales archaeon]|nr:MAG: PAS domain-containing protein [Thermoplasmatales archaeon]